MTKARKIGAGRCVGIDFGTTNSAIAVANAGAAIEAARTLRRANPHAVYEIRPIITYLPGNALPAP